MLITNILDKFFNEFPWTILGFVWGSLAIFYDLYDKDSVAEFFMIIAVVSLATANIIREIRKLQK